MFKIGEKVIRQIGNWDEVKVGHTYVVRSQNSDGVYLDELNGLHLTGCYDENAFVVANSTPNYAAAFNMWLDDFNHSPQAYEDSHSTAIRHLTEKLNGEEPSYGMICEQMLIEYLEKVK